MNALAQSALTASVVASVIGGVVLALVVLRYGWPSPLDEPSARTMRRVLLTRLGHTMAAVCFAVSAGLGILVLVAGSAPRVEIPGAAPRRVEEVRALDARVSAVEAALQRVDGGITTVLTRLEQLERGRR
ncbi:MAG: hypothetical protein ACREJG_05310 [Candidatus Rokuibacteriota bacterium]